MESPNNRGDKAPTRHLLPPNETLVSRMGYIYSNYWPKGPQAKPQTTQATAKAICFSLQTNDNTLLLKTTSTSRTWSSQTSAYLGPLSLLTSIHD